jgi:hypothetical protein
MKTTIQLKHNGQQLTLSAEQAVSLHNELTEAISKAGINADAFRTVESPSGTQTFTRKQESVQTDC